MATFVLVHGAWHGGWCWYKLVAQLEARGHSVMAPDLPGSGRDCALSSPATYRDYVARIVEIIEAQPAPVVLVGHSMGGGVITGAAEAVPEKIAKLIYLSAFLGPSGCGMSQGGAEKPSIATGYVVPAADGRSVTFKPEGLRAAFYADCPDEDIALARLCLTPQSLEPMIAPVVWTAARCGSVPRAYIACTEDKIKHDIEEQRTFIETMPGKTEFLTLPSSHSPFFSMPDQLADMLESLLG